MAVFLAVCLLGGVTMAYAGADDADAYLDALFGKGKISLSEVPLGGIDLKAEDVTLSEEYLATVTQDGHTPDEWIQALYPVSISPSGGQALLSDGNIALAFHNGRARQISVSQERSVADEYGNLEKLLSLPLASFFGLGQSRVVWSPDGRYATFYNWSRVLQMSRFEYDPYLIDMETGEFILLATYVGKPVKGQAAAPVAACFTRDGRYLYFMMYGNFGYRTALLRYDLSAGKMETCCSVTDLDYYPQLSELRDGSLMLMRDADPRRNRKTVNKIGPVRYKGAGGGWMVFANTLPLDNQQLYAKEIMYSEQSGYGIMTAVNRKTGPGYLLRFLPDAGFTGLDEIWAFDSEADSMVKMTLTELQEMDAEKGRKFETFSACLLSPGGRYALCATVGQGEYHLRLVRLEDMKQVDIAGLDKSTVSGTAMNGSIPCWSGETVLLMKNKALTAFRFE